jgi:hypothetical protein
VDLGARNGDPGSGLRLLEAISILRRNLEIIGRLHRIICAFIFCDLLRIGGEQRLISPGTDPVDLPVTPPVGQMGNFYTFEPFYTVPAERGRNSAFAPRYPEQISMLQLQR